MGLTSSSWPWSHPTHLWTCSGCSCPQSGKQRDCLKWAITEGALTCLGSLPEAQKPALPSVSPLPSALLHYPHHHLSCRQEALLSPPPPPILLATLKTTDTPLICADRIGILGNMAQGHHSTQVPGFTTKAEGSLSLSAVCVGDEGHHWGPDTHPRQIFQIAKTLGVWGGVV